MRRAVLTTVAALSFALVPMMIGCEDTVSKHSETKTNSDGTTVKREEKVTRNADGTTSKTQTVDVDKPDTNHDVKVKVDTK